ncbi:MAG: phosphate acetyltransferase [Candidatus Omnitrophica bacterium]|nr:phosphate acetyltransferase [Candidatus Omnitrophota bacterium]
MSIIESLRNRASANLKKIVLPESEDSRTMEALEYILDNKIAKVILIGKETLRSSVKSKNQADLEIIDPMTYKDTESLISEYYELRKTKGTTLDEARKVIREDWLSFGAMLVRRGAAAGFVAGASHTTAATVRAALRCMKIDREIGVVAGSFLMEIPNSPYGENGVFIFADCGVNPEPNARQLAGIGVLSAKLFQQLVGKTPHVAFLSYSSKGSAEGPLVDKIREAVSRAKGMMPDISIDGEFQVDSAIVPEVARIKCPGNDVAGRANVLIFPDLNSGNISYKLTQRLANARAVGPLLMGFTEPCSDLSRGCSVDDIIDAVAITSVRAR